MGQGTDGGCATWFQKIPFGFLSLTEHEFLTPGGYTLLV